MKRLAATLGTDFSGLLNAMLIEALPAFEARVDALKRKQFAAAYRVSEDLVLIVHAAVEAGWAAKKGEELAAMKSAVSSLRNLDEQTTAAVLVAAQNELRKIHDGVDLTTSPPVEL